MNRTEYRSKLESSLEAMDSRIADLESQVRKAKVDGKSTIRQLLDEVKSKRDHVRIKMREVSSATDFAWDEMKKGLDGAWTELEKSYRQARSQFANIGTPS